jgi:hypothetical protein
MGRRRRRRRPLPLVLVLVLLAVVAVAASADTPTSATTSWQAPDLLAPGCSEFYGPVDEHGVPRRRPGSDPHKMPMTCSWNLQKRIVYMHNPKSGSSTVRQRFEVLGFPLQTTACVSVPTELAAAGDEEDAITIFTFVRDDPMDRAISGLLEVLGSRMDNISLDMITNDPDEVLRNLDMVLKSLVDGAAVTPALENVYLWAHLEPQVYHFSVWHPGAMRVLRPNFIGSVNHIDDHWSQLMTRIDLDPEQVKKVLEDIPPARASSRSVKLSQLKELTIKAVEDDPERQRILCTVLARDFRCLGATMPLACQGQQPELYAFNSMFV